MSTVGAGPRRWGARLGPVWQLVCQRLAEHDKRQHMRWSLGLTLLGALVMPLSLSLVLVFLIGLAKECWDQRYGSGFCLWDIAGNLIGMAAGGLLAGGFMS